MQDRLLGVRWWQDGAGLMCYATQWNYYGEPVGQAFSVLAFAESA